MINPMNFVLGVLVARDLDAQDKVTLGLLGGLSSTPLAAILAKPVADKVTERTKKVKSLQTELDAIKIRVAPLLKAAETIPEKVNTPDELKEWLNKEENFRIVCNFFGIRGSGVGSSESSATKTEQ